MGEEDTEKSHETGHDRDCTADQITIKLNRTIHGKTHILSKCFPGVEKCKCKNIEAEIKTNAKRVDKDAKVTVECITKMSPTCKEALKELEEKEKKEKKKHEEEGHNKKCDKDQMLVKVTNTVHGISRDYSKCFPKTQCQCANIEKELNGDAAHMPGAKVKVACGLEKEDDDKKEEDEDEKADEDDKKKEKDEDEKANEDDKKKEKDDDKKADE